MTTQKNWCNACKKEVTLSTGKECGLDPEDRSFDDYIAVTACLPCDREVGLAAREVQKAKPQ